MTGPQHRVATKFIPREHNRSDLQLQGIKDAKNTKTGLARPRRAAAKASQPVLMGSTANSV